MYMEGTSYKNHFDVRHLCITFLLKIVFLKPKLDSPEVRAIGILPIPLTFRSLDLHTLLLLEGLLSLPRSKRNVQHSKMVDKLKQQCKHIFEKLLRNCVYCPVFIVLSYNCIKLII